MCYDWRWRLASALVVGLLLFGAEKSGLSTRWPRSKWIAHMGRTSYSLFLVHFPVPLLVSAFWARLRWTSAPAALAGLFLAFTASVAAAFVFHRFVEKPAAALARRS
jgi:peptidoglycan/LPS O-acetylase OafA/YrhL